jgi:AcrR family transcriptional regulator
MITAASTAEHRAKPPQSIDKERKTLRQAGLRRSQKDRRAATEQAIIKAFEQLLARGGIGALGINALVKEAGVGKKQVYDYFGGLNGVAAAWVTSSAVWRPIEEIIDEPWDAFLKRSPVDKLILVCGRYAASLRKNPLLCELLSGEFTNSGEVKSAVEHVRQLIRLDFEKVLKSDERLEHPDMLALSVMAYSCATYLGLRAHHQPIFFGFDLSVETSWLTVMSMFERALRLADPERIATQDMGKSGHVGGKH